MWTGQKLKQLPAPVVRETMRTIGGPMYGGKPHWETSSRISARAAFAFSTRP